MRAPRTLVLAAMIGLGSTRPTAACSRVAPLPPPESLIQRTSVIVLAETSANRLPDSVEFHVVDVLKGQITMPLIVLEGRITDEDDFNDAPFPYGYVRRGGRHGDCYAKSYRVGAQYLLMLQTIERTLRPQPHVIDWALTPYWEALAPTNEQVVGAADRWVAWVRARVREQPR